MTSNGSSKGLHGSFELCDAPAPPGAQIMQVDLAKATVKEILRATQAGKNITIGFGKHLVCIRLITDADEGIKY